MIGILPPEKRRCYIFADDDGAIALKADIAQVQVSDFRDLHAAIKDDAAGTIGLVKLKMGFAVHALDECDCCAKLRLKPASPQRIISSG